MAIRKIPHLAVWSNSVVGSSNPYIFHSTSAVKSCSFAVDHGMIVTDDAEAHEFKISPQSFILISQNIRHISCNLTMSCLVSISGQVFVVGKDPSEYGLLGIPGCFDTNLVPILQNIRCVGVSVGTAHIGVIDRIGNIYTWGSGSNGELAVDMISKQQPPTLVQSAKIFSVKQILCGNKYTMIGTTGGFMYLYGTLSICHEAKVPQQNQPYSIKELEKLFIQQIVGCKDFVAVLTETKDAYVIHSCLIPLKLPNQYKVLAGSNSTIYGITKENSFLHEWKFTNRSLCQLKTLEAKAFVFDEIFADNINIFSGIGVSVAFESHLRIEDKLVAKQFGMVRVKQELTVNEIKEFRRYSHQIVINPNYKFPTKENQLEKAAKIISRAFQKILKDSYIDIRDFASLKKISVLSNNISELVNTLGKIFQRNKVICQGKALKDLIYFREIIEKIGLEKKSGALDSLFAVVDKMIKGKYFKFFEIAKTILKNLSMQEDCTKKLLDVLRLKTIERYRDVIGKILKFRDVLLKIEKGVERLQLAREKNEKKEAFEVIAKVFETTILKTNVINRLISFSAQKNTRILIIKYYDMWKRHRVSSKIAEITKKYSSKTNARGLAMKISNIMRRNFKHSFNCLKHCSKRLVNAKYGLLLLLGPIKKNLKKQQQYGFHSIFVDFTSKLKFLKKINSLIKSKMGTYYLMIYQHIEEKKKYFLLRIDLKLSSLYDKFNYKSLSKGFAKFKDLVVESYMNDRVSEMVRSQTLLNISFRGDLSYKKDEISPSPFSIPHSPIEKIKSKISVQTKRTPYKPIKSKAQVKLNQNSLPKFLEARRGSVPSPGLPPKLLETRRGSVTSLNAKEPQKISFETLLNKSFDSNSESKKEIKVEENFTPSDEKFIPTGEINKYKEDFEQENFVNYKLGLGKLEKSFNNMCISVFFFGFTEVKKWKSQPKPIRNYKFMICPSISEESIESVSIEEPLEEAKKSPWESQLQILGLSHLQKVYQSRLKSYFFLATEEI